MWFYEAKDWLGKEGPYAFRFDHIIFIVLTIVLGVVLSIVLHKKSKKTVKIVLISLWVFSVAIELWYYGYIFYQSATDPVNHPFNLETMLPFHSCLAFMYVFPVAMWCKDEKIKLAAENFLVIVNMIIGFITLFVGCPSKGSSALSFAGLQSLIFHGIIVIVPLLMVTTNLYDIKMKDLKYGLACFFTLSIFMWLFDNITGCDYFYFYDGHTFGVLEWISTNVHHFVWTLIVVSCYVITGVTMHCIIVFIKFLIESSNIEETPIVFKD